MTTRATQLADTWTAGVDPFEYAAFVQLLYRQIATIVEGPDGVTAWEWTHEADVVHDSATFGDDEDVDIDEVVDEDDAVQAIRRARQASMKNKKAPAAKKPASLLTKKVPEPTTREKAARRPKEPTQRRTETRADGQVKSVDSAAMAHLTSSECSMRHRRCRSTRCVHLYLRSHPVPNDRRECCCNGLAFLAFARRRAPPIHHHLRTVGARPARIHMNRHEAPRCA